MNCRVTYQMIERQIQIQNTEQQNEKNFTIVDNQFCNIYITEKIEIDRVAKNPEHTFSFNDKHLLYLVSKFLNYLKNQKIQYTHLFSNFNVVKDKLPENHMMTYNKLLIIGTINFNQNKNEDLQNNIIIAYSETITSNLDKQIINKKLKYIKNLVEQITKIYETKVKNRIYNGSTFDYTFNQPVIIFLNSYSNKKYKETITNQTDTFELTNIDNKKYIIQYKYLETTIEEMIENSKQLKDKTKDRFATDQIQINNEPPQDFKLAVLHPYYGVKHKLKIIKKTFKPEIDSPHFMIFTQDDSLIEHTENMKNEPSNTKMSSSLRLGTQLLPPIKVEQNKINIFPLKEPVIHIIEPNGFIKSMYITEFEKQENKMSNSSQTQKKEDDKKEIIVKSTKQKKKVDAKTTTIKTAKNQQKNTVQKPIEQNTITDNIQTTNNQIQTEDIVVTETMEQIIVPEKSQTEDIVVTQNMEQIIVPKNNQTEQIIVPENMEQIIVPENNQTEQTKPTKQNISKMLENIGAAQFIKDTPQKTEFNLEESEDITNINFKEKGEKIQNKQKKDQILAIAQKQLKESEDPEQYWKNLTITTNQSAKYHLCFRWTEHPNNNQTIFENPQLFQDTILEANKNEQNQTNIQKMVFQIERGEETNKLHYQGYIHLIKKKRPKSLAKKLNHLFFGIEIAQAIDYEAVIEYCKKIETRIEGPFEFPKNTREKI